MESAEKNYRRGTNWEEFWEKGGGGELGEMKDRTRQESRKSEHFFMIWNENISLDQSVIARGGGGGRETCKGYFRLTDWLIGLLWGRHADMLFRATVIAIAFLLLIIYSIIPRSTASQKPKVMSSDPTLRVWSWFGFLVELLFPVFIW